MKETLKSALQQVLTDEQISQLDDKELKTLKNAFGKMYTRKFFNKDGSRTKAYAGYMTLKRLLEANFGLQVIPADFGQEGQDINKLEPLNESMFTPEEREFHAGRSQKPQIELTY